MIVGIVGAAGYTGGELIRLLCRHERISSINAVSQSQSGKRVNEVHSDLLGEVELTFSSELTGLEDLVFLCMGHGNSSKFIERNRHVLDCKLIDMSTDFRPRKNKYNFIYGLPELEKEKIKCAGYIANPGCFATAIQLALLPLARQNQIQGDVHMHGITGSTGAGQNPTGTTHFSWRNNNVSIYKLFDHQHLAEITESIESLQPLKSALHFVPVRGNFSRGIFISTYLESDLSVDEAMHIYKDFYRDSPFVHVTQSDIALKDVVNTNNCHLQLNKSKNLLHITSVIDNLVKGASGQAVQNMNLMMGFPEDEGLKLKAIAF